MTHEERMSAIAPIESELRTQRKSVEYLLDIAEDILLDRQIEGDPRFTTVEAIALAELIHRVSPEFVSLRKQISSILGEPL